FIFLDQRARIHAKTYVARVKAMQLDDDCLREGRDSDGFVQSRGYIEHAKFEGTEGRMRPNVPPDFLGVVDAVQTNKQVDVVLVLAPGAEVIRDAGAREAPEDGGAE